MARILGYQVFVLFLGIQHTYADNEANSLGSGPKCGTPMVPHNEYMYFDAIFGPGYYQSSIRKRRHTAPQHRPAQYDTAQNDTEDDGPSDDGLRIVGGHEAVPHSWPWNCRVRPCTPTSCVYLCGGSVVGEKWVVTAAHCIPSGADRGLITVGFHTIFTGQGTNHSIKSIHPHEEWDRYRRVNDIALICVETPFSFGRQVQPLCIPSADTCFGADVMCVVTGWGYMTESGPLASNLQELVVKIIHDDICSLNAVYGSYVYPESTVCAGYLDGGRDSCAGDSGGPLMCRLGDNMPWQLYGIVSWGYGCAREAKPGVYTKVPAFKEWIDQKIYEYDEPIASETYDQEYYECDYATCNNAFTFRRKRRSFHEVADQDGDQTCAQSLQMPIYFHDPDVVDENEEEDEPEPEEEDEVDQLSEGEVAEYLTDGSSGYDYEEEDYEPPYREECGGVLGDSEEEAFGAIVGTPGFEDGTGYNKAKCTWTWTKGDDQDSKTIGVKILTTKIGVFDGESCQDHDHLVFSCQDRTPDVFCGGQGFIQRGSSSCGRFNEESSLEISFDALERVRSAKAGLGMQFYYKVFEGRQGEINECGDLKNVFWDGNEITSFNKIVTYPRPGSTCHYVLTVPPGEKVQIKFGKTTNLPSRENRLSGGRTRPEFCKWDFLELRTFPGRQLIGKFCGTESFLDDSYRFFDTRVRVVLATLKTNSRFSGEKLDMTICPVGYENTYSNNEANPGEVSYSNSTGYGDNEGGYYEDNTYYKKK